MRRNITPSCLWNCQQFSTNVENSVKFLKILECNVPCKLIIPILSIYQDSEFFHRYSYIAMFFADLFMIARKSDQSVYPTTDEQERIVKGCIHTLWDFTLFLEKMKCVHKWMNVEIFYWVGQSRYKTSKAACSVSHVNLSIIYQNLLSLNWSSYRNQ